MDFSACIVSGATENQQIHDTPGSKAVCVRQAARDQSQSRGWVEGRSRADQAAS